MCLFAVFDWVQYLLGTQTIVLDCSILEFAFLCRDYIAPDSANLLVNILDIVHTL